MPGTNTLTSTTLASTHQRYGGRSTRGGLSVAARSIMLGLLVRSLTFQLIGPRRVRGNLEIHLSREGPRHTDCHYQWLTSSATLGLPLSINPISHQFPREKSLVFHSPCFRGRL